MARNPTLCSGLFMTSAIAFLSLSSSINAITFLISKRSILIDILGMYPEEFAAFVLYFFEPAEAMGRIFGLEEGVEFAQDGTMGTDLGFSVCSDGVKICGIAESFQSSSEFSMPFINSENSIPFLSKITEPKIQQKGYRESKLMCKNCLRICLRFLAY